MYTDIICSQPLDDALFCLLSILSFLQNLTWPKNLLKPVTNFVMLLLPFLTIVTDHQNTLTGQLNEKKYLFL